MYKYFVEKIVFVFYISYLFWLRKEMHEHMVMMEYFVCGILNVMDFNAQCLVINMNCI